MTPTSRPCAVSSRPSSTPLLDTPGGRAYVAWKAAANVKFDDVLTFQSDDGIPSILRLRDFAEQFMGSKGGG